MSEHDDGLQDDIGRRSRAAMHAESAAYTPPDGWATVVGRLDRRPSLWGWLAQHRLVMGIAAIGVALVAIVAASLVGGDESAQDLEIVDTPTTTERLEVVPTTSAAVVPVTTEAPTTAAVTTTAAPTTTAPPPSPPGAFVFVTQDGRVIRLVIGSEPEAVTTLPAQPGIPDELPGLSVDDRLAVSPDGSMLYLSRPRDRSDHCLHDLVAVSLLDGSISVLGSGDDPAVSPDGTKLAYVVKEAEDENGFCPATFVVRDLATGVERQWLDPISHGVEGPWYAAQSLVRLQWASDNRTVVLAASWEELSPFVVDTAAPEGMLPLDSSLFADLGGNPDQEGNWALVGVRDIDGRPTVVLGGGCYGVPAAQCPIAGQMMLVPLDGSPRTTTADDQWLLSFAYGPAGYLYRGCAPDPATGCETWPLWVQPNEGEPVLVLPDTPEGFPYAWLPLPGGS